MKPMVGAEGLETVDKEELRKLILERALKRGDFTLASGKKSHFYIDGKQVMFHPRGLLLIAEAFLAEIADCQVDAIGGLEMGAIPIAVAVSLRSGQIGRPIPAFFVRKEAKGHGTNLFIEGCLQQGSRVVICDDVLTTGTSVLKAVEKVEEYDCRIVRVVSLVDREEGAVEALAAKGLEYHPVFTLSELGESHARTG
ncbi:MAG TPA: orotate phosphoribosyltransferase [Phycisphaerae bacterium]|nr:orotate phosphoribosyltransferase [Phycisphaerae bacterium]